MITPSDSDYLDTKLIKQGKKQLQPPFSTLAKWVNDAFRANPMNILYDRMEDKTPRLNVIFEFEEDEDKFNLPNSIMFDREKQKAVANKFTQIVQEQHPDKPKKFFDFIKFNSATNQLYDTKDLWVIFNSFSSIAKAEANGKIPTNEITELKKEFEQNGLWEISRFGHSTTFLFYTDDQIKINRENGVQEKMKERYYKILKRFDEFDYYSYNSFSLIFDSKENFDNNYQSNWYYYYK